MRFNLRREYSSPHSRIQTQGDFGTDLLNAQKLREAPRGHPRPTGQAGRLYGIRERGLCTLERHRFPFFFSGSLLSPHV